MVDGIIYTLRQQRVQPFELRKGASSIRRLVNDKLPDAETAYKFISLNGGVLVNLFYPMGCRSRADRRAYRINTTDRGKTTVGIDTPKQG